MAIGGIGAKIAMRRSTPDRQNETKAMPLSINKSSGLIY
jgi:hypothetical protein